MPRLNPYPVAVPVSGGQAILEHVGKVSTGTDEVSIGHMVVGTEWVEDWRCSEFEEVVVMIKGILVLEYDGGRLEARAGQSVIIPPNRRIRHSCGAAGAEFLSICVPAFTPERAHVEE